MALGPRFSADKFRSVLKGALGGGPDSVHGAMTHIGAQNFLKTGASVKDAKTIIRKLTTSGAIKDEGQARNEFRKAERVANAADRMRVAQTKDDRLKELHAGPIGGPPKSLAQSIVDAHQHSTSVLGDKTMGQHYTSISEALKKPLTNGGAGSSGMRMGASNVPLARPIVDIPFD